MPLLTPEQRQNWLRRHAAEPGYMLVHISEADSLQKQLTFQQQALQAISAILGPYTLAAKGNPVAAAQRCYKKVEEYRKECERLQEIQTRCSPADGKN